MTKTEFIRIASRIIALYLLAWALADCTYLPQFLYSLVHHLTHQDYWAGYYKLETASMVLRIAALMLGVLFFWNGGPAIVRLLSPSETTAEEVTDPAKS